MGPTVIPLLCSIGCLVTYQEDQKIVISSNPVEVKLGGTKRLFNTLQDKLKSFFVLVISNSHISQIFITSEKISYLIKWIIFFYTACMKDTFLFAKSHKLRLLKTQHVGEAGCA